MKRTLSLFFRYIIDRRRVIATLCLMLAAFATVIALYALPLSAVGYAALISLCIGLAACVWGFVSSVRRHAALSELMNRVELGLDSLPEADTLIEADYQALLARLHSEHRRLAGDHRRSLADMGDYYTLWTHQIKMPLAALDLLIQTGCRDKQILQAELFRIEQYVEMALSYIRLESRDSDYVLRLCPLDPILRRAVRKYAKLFILSDVTLTYEGTDQRVLTDEKWLGFVLEQLLSNAVKYAPGGQVTLGARDGQLFLRDTGLGIDPGDLPRVCEKGFTGYNGRQEERSTGLGLYLCKRILDQLSHRLSLQSEPGRGTTVTIEFPQEDFILE